MLDVFRRKLPRSSLLWFTAAGLAAGGAALVAQSHIAAIEARHPDVGAPKPVVVAASDLVRGATLHPLSLRLIDMPSTLVPPGAVTAVESVSGRVLGADLAEGEVLTETRLAAGGAGPVAALVPAGLRAFVLPAGPPEGSLRSGDEIDVLATYGANAGRPYTETVATGVEVLDVIESDAPVTAGVAAASTGPPVVILTDPLTVERLARASSLALLSISIVGDDDAVSSTGDASALR